MSDALDHLSIEELYEYKTINSAIYRTIQNVNIEHLKSLITEKNADAPKTMCYLFNTIRFQHKIDEPIIIEIVKLFLEHGAPIDKIVTYHLYDIEFSVMHEACVHGFYNVVKLLLEHGSNPNIKTDGEYPIETAMDFDRTDIVKLLMEYGANTSHIK